MGDPLICSASEPSILTEELVCRASEPVTQASETPAEIEPQGRIGFDPEEDHYSSTTPNLFSSQSEQVCRGSYRSLEDYLAKIDHQNRSAKVGPFLASMSKSEEEKIPTNPKIKIVPGTTYALNQVWKGLPQELRVYLDNMGLRGATDLAVAYETGGSGGRWHIMEMSSASPGTGGTTGTTPKAPPPAPSTGSTPPPPPTGGTTPSPGATPPPTEPTFNISISSVGVGVGMVGLMVAFDQGVIRKKFPGLPREALLPMNLGAFYGLNYLMFKGGLIQAPTWGHVWKPMTNQLPFLASLGMIAGVLLDRVGAWTGTDTLRFGQLGNEVGTPLLTLGAYYTIVSSKTLSPLAAGLISSRGFSFAAPAGGAGVLGGVGQGLAVAGIFLIGNVAIGGAKELTYWLLTRNESEGVQKEMKLRKFLADRQQRSWWPDGWVGDIGNGLLGNLADGVISAGCLISDDVDKGRNMELEEWRSEMVNGSETFGKWARGNLVSMVADSINLQTGEVDWAEVDRKFQAFVEGSTPVDNKGKVETMSNATLFKNGFQTLELTGHAAYEAQQFKDWLTSDLRISYGSRDAVKQMTWWELTKTFREAKPRVERLAREIGVVKTVDGQDVMVPPELLTPAQKKRVEEELLPLNNQILFTGAAIELLDPKRGAAQPK